MLETDWGIASYATIVHDRYLEKKLIAINVSQMEQKCKSAPSLCWWIWRCIIRKLCSKLFVISSILRSAISIFDHCFYVYNWTWLFFTCNLFLKPLDILALIQWKSYNICCPIGYFMFVTFAWRYHFCVISLWNFKVKLYSLFRRNIIS